MKLASSNTSSFGFSKEKLLDRGAVRPSSSVILLGSNV